MFAVTFFFFAGRSGKPLSAKIRASTYKVSISKFSQFKEETVN